MSCKLYRQLIFQSCHFRLCGTPCKMNSSNNTSILRISSSAVTLNLWSIWKLPSMKSCRFSQTLPSHTELGRLNTKKELDKRCVDSFLDSWNSTFDHQFVAPYQTMWCFLHQHSWSFLCWNVNYLVYFNGITNRSWKIFLVTGFILQS